MALDSPLTRSASWFARPASADHDDQPPEAFTSGRMPLAQAWEPATHALVRGGWAHAAWTPDQLLIDAYFAGGNARNSARRLNERTWELGDVCEVFIHAAEASHYAEVHVTPENQRLQLCLPWHAQRCGPPTDAPLEKFMIADPNWVQSRARVDALGWSVRLRVPAACFLPASDRLRSGVRLRLAVCRYDYGLSSTATLSSTAHFTRPSFHRWHEWHELALQT